MARRLFAASSRLTSDLVGWPVMGSALTQAIKTVDLPGLVDESFPGARDARNRVRPVWRDPNTKSRDAGLKRFADGWLLTDFGLGRSFNAYGFLVELVGLEPRAATRELLARAGVQDQPRSSSPKVAGAVVPVQLPDLPESLLELLEVRRRWLPSVPLWDLEDPNTHLDNGPEFQSLANWLADCITLEIAGAS
jgi:hypothetical protein